MTTPMQPPEPENASDHAMPRDERVPHRIGPYRPIRLIGQGGMGSVWLAQDSRNNDLPPVALKVPTRGHLATHARFSRECAILSALDHPHIAKLIDAGTDSEGWPYLAMEHVDGVPIDQWCIEQQLEIDQILRLFLQALQAVQYAHEQLVLHRDIKPTNILVTSQGQVKLLDFGIAKLLHPQADASTQITQWLGQAWTPAYAAPEMHSGDGKPGIPTEVYALGVVAYELLTHQSPYRQAFEKGWDLKRAVIKHSPQAPSRMLKSHPRGSDVQWRKRTRVSLRGPVDQMVLTALRKTPRLRYESPGAWVQDIQSHLNGQPIQAARTSWAQRLREALIEHQIFLRTASMVSVISLAGMAAAWWQATQAKAAEARAETHFNNTRKLTTSMLFEVYREIEWLPGGDKARLSIASSAQRYLDMLLAEDIRNPELMLELAQAYATLAHAQVNNVAFEMQHALANYQQAWNLSLRALAIEPHPSPEHVLSAQKIGLRMANFLVYAREPEAALKQFDQVQRLLDRGSEEPVADPPADFGVLRFGYHIGRGALLMLDAAGEAASAHELTQAKETLRQLEQAKIADSQMIQRLQGDWVRLQADWLMEYAPQDQLAQRVIPLLEQSVQAWEPLSKHEARLQQRIIAAELQITETHILARQHEQAWRSMQRWSERLDSIMRTDHQQSILPAMALRRDLFKARLLLLCRKPHQAETFLQPAKAHLGGLQHRSTLKLVLTPLEAEYDFLETALRTQRTEEDLQKLKPARQTLNQLAARKVLNRYGRMVLKDLEEMEAGRGGHARQLPVDAHRAQPSCMRHA